MPDINSAIHKQLKYNSSKLNKNTGDAFSSAKSPMNKFNAELESRRAASAAEDAKAKELAASTYKFASSPANQAIAKGNLPDEVTKWLYKGNGSPVLQQVFVAGRTQNLDMAGLQKLRYTALEEYIQSHPGCGFDLTLWPFKEEVDDNYRPPKEVVEPLKRYW